MHVRAKESTPSAAQASARVRRRRGLLRRVVFAAVACLLAALFVEGASSLVLSFRGGPADERLGPELAAYTRHDSDLGWANVPSARCPSVFGPGLDVSINSLGFRGKESAPAAGRYRVVCLGDSYTFGYLVGDDESLPAALALRNPRLQVVNMGQCGYCLGQAMLWFERDGPALRPNLVILTFINDDLDRTVRDFMFGCPKPKFEAQAGRLAVRNRPVPPRSPFSTGNIVNRLQGLATGRLIMKLAGTDRSEPAALSQHKLETAALVFGRLRAACEACGSKLVLVRLPACRITLRGLAQDAAEGARIMAFLREHPAAKGIPMLDLAEAFAAMPVGRLPALYGPDHLHPSAEGNAWLAGLVERWVKSVDTHYPN